MLLKKLALRWSSYATVVLSSSGEADAEWRGPRRRHQCLALLVRGVAAAHGLNSRKGLRMSMIANLTVYKITVLQGLTTGFEHGPEPAVQLCSVLLQSSLLLVRFRAAPTGSHGLHDGNRPPSRGPSHWLGRK